VTLAPLDEVRVGFRKYNAVQRNDPRYHPSVQRALTLGLALLLTACHSVKRETAAVASLPAPSTLPREASPIGALVSAPHPATSVSVLEPTNTVPMPPPGDTHGTIACGETRCRAGKEACIPVADGVKCVPSSSPLVEQAEYAYACDEGSDCAAGSLCCAHHMGGGYCEPRVGNAPPRDCNAELCLPDAGAPCTAGERCLVDQDSVQGYCAISTTQATCAPGKRCSSDTGVCVCTYATKSGHCGGPIDDEALDAGRIGVFQCTKPSDCGTGMRCHTSTQAYARGTFCSPATELANSTYLCDTDAQCRNAMQEPFKRAKCVSVLHNKYLEDPNFPPWIFVCQFE
jgi:hypothetical protein